MQQPSTAELSELLLVLASTRLVLCCHDEFVDWLSQSDLD